MTGVEDITSNIQKLVEITAGMNTPASTTPMNIVLDKCTVVLEELRTIQVLSETHSEGLCEQLKHTEKSIMEIETLFDRIDKLNDFVRNTKCELNKLEKLCNIVERQ